MAKLAAVVESLESVGEAHRDLYAQAEDGKFVLLLDGPPRGFVEGARLNDFRSRNAELSNKTVQLESRLQAYDGIDPEAARRALEAQAEQQRDLDAKKLLRAEDVQSLIDRAVQPLAQQIQAERDARAAAEPALEAKTVDEGIIAAARRQGDLHPGSEELLVIKARAAGWSSVDGALRQVVDGVPAYSRSQAGQPRSIDEWIVEEALSQLGYLWKPSTGGGGAGSRAPADPNVIDPHNRAAFRANLDAIAKGTKKVGALT